MKDGIHPKLNNVCFIDAPTGQRILSRSTLTSREKEMIDGEEYNVIHLSTSGASHPAFTGVKQILDTAGRIDKFKRRYQKK
ncbi:MAG TPA: type B 50S ribosomal protein L31 [Kiritimatiellia bacterium]|nr:type B 50S ribosomal protein L31 [Kiritimatiellia bacterium]